MQNVEVTNKALLIEHLDTQDSHEISISQKVDHDDYSYYPGDIIEFTIICTNHSKQVITDLHLLDIIPNCVNPVSGDQFTVTTTSGKISQSKKVINVYIDKIEPNENIVVTITGKIEDKV